MSQTPPENTAVDAATPAVVAPAINDDTPVTPPAEGETTTVADATDTDGAEDGDGPGDTEDDDPPGDH